MNEMKMKFYVLKLMILIPAGHLVFGCFFLTIAAASFPETTTMSDARSLELTKGMSFVLDAYDDVAKVIVGQPAIADVRAMTSRTVLINAIEVGTTNLILWYNDGSTEVYHIAVKYDLSDIRKKVETLVPGADVDITASISLIMVSGSVEDAVTMDRVMQILEAFAPPERIKNLMTLKGPLQVQLDARIVEVSKSAMKRYGLGFLMQGNAARQLGIGFVPPGVELPGLSAGSGSGSNNNTNDNNNTNGSNNGGFSMDSPFASAFQLAFHLVNDDISGTLSLLKGQGLASIMARPTLVTMSGQEASFHVGGSFPIPISSSQGTGFSSQLYGVELEFTPTVTARDTIHLAVKTRVSDIDYSTSVTSGGATVPGVTNREASSTLQLRDGQTFAIAGLLKESINSFVNKVPLLGDLPVIGSAFRSKEYIKDETELIIMVTPRLVKAMDPADIPPMPGDSEIFEQNDLEFFFLDRIWKPTAEKTGMKPIFSGPSGFED